MNITRLHVTLLFTVFVLSLTFWLPRTVSAATNPVVTIETSKGDIKVELFAQEAPLTVENFLAYIKEGYYDNLIFHRVISGFMIQGGGLDGSMSKKSTKTPVKNEARSDLPNRRGTIAMARTNVINSATSQFFINLVDNQSLNHRDTTSRGYGYAVFGKVIEGMKVVDIIGRVKTRRFKGMSDVPVEPVVIKTIRLSTPAAVPAPPEIR